MRYELTDYEWAAIKPFLPNKPRGVPRVNDRRVLNGIFWVLRSGAPWRDLPTIYGPRTTCYNRFVRWRRAGIWDRILQALTRAHDAAVQMIDTSMVRVHQHACIADSGNQNTGVFCPDCGVRIYHVPNVQDVLALKPGTLDDTTWLRPDYFVWMKSAQGWVPVPNGVTALEGQTWRAVLSKSCGDPYFSQPRLRQVRDGSQRAAWGGDREPRFMPARKVTFSTARSLLLRAAGRSEPALNA